MSLNFLITGTDAGVGKSTVGCALGFAFRARGLRVGVMKPAETGCEERDGALDPADARALALASGCSLPLELICPYRYRAPLAPAAAAETDSLPPPDLGRIAGCFEQISAASDIVLVEGARGLAVPLTWQADFADLAVALGLELIVVIANRLGCLNAAMLTFRYAAIKGLRMAGWILNDVEPAVTPAALTNSASLARLTDVPSLGTMRFKEPLGIGVVEKLLARRDNPSDE
ncbi:MAG TPA: dethiobiotin synthase [Candidatus Binataceae bacterium]|nr:dethiobiotin synthase [Candidatus Binataceae bacterium]